MSRILIALVASAAVGVVAVEAMAGAGCGKCASSTKKCTSGAKVAGAEASSAETVVKSAEADSDISTDVLQKLVSAGAAAAVLDARSGKYYDGQRIPGAKQVGAAPTAEKIAELVKSKDALVVTYCSNTKCPASSKLASHLKELGYSNVIEYPEGIAGWKEAGNKVESDS